jgi:hypothetical protein
MVDIDTSKNFKQASILSNQMLIPISFFFIFHHSIKAEFYRALEVNIAIATLFSEVLVNAYSICCVKENYCEANRFWATQWGLKRRIS